MGRTRGDHTFERRDDENEAMRWRRKMRGEESGGHCCRRVVKSRLRRISVRTGLPRVPRAAIRLWGSATARMLAPRQPSPVSCQVRSEAHAGNGFVRVGSIVGTAIVFSSVGCVGDGDGAVWG